MTHVSQVEVYEWSQGQHPMDTKTIIVRVR